jgi:hypothetical protein
MPSMHRPLTGKPVATSVASRLRGFYPCEDPFRQFGVTRPTGRSLRRVRVPPGFKSLSNNSGYPKFIRSWC